MQTRSIGSCFKALITFLCILTPAIDAAAQDEIDWPNFEFQPLAQSIQPLTHITHAGDGSGRLFAVEKIGNIRILSGHALSTTPFLAISDRVFNGPERGLFSVAFAPDFRTSGEFYVNYTRRPDGATIVSRFTVGSDTNAADNSTEEILLVVPQPFANHNGGQIAFGPDGFLYIGMGDGGGQGDPNKTAQDPMSLLGKILRIDVRGSSTNYSIPPSNPFATGRDALPEIWASGLRNPWRFSFDRATGDLFIADVGELREEEINFQKASSPGGENYGWSLYEANLPFRTNFNAPAASALTFPVARYPRALGQSITGGHVFRSSETNRTHGVYIFSDYMTARLGALRQVGANWIQADFGIRSNALRRPLQITSFGEDEAGNIYAVESGRDGRGEIYKVVDSNTAHLPVFSLTNGTYTSAQSVRLTSWSAGARIHYTTDGTNPSETSPFVFPGDMLTIGETTILKARTYRSDVSPSPIATLRLTMLVGLDISPGTGPVTNGTQLTIHASDSNAIVRYTLDGSTPTEDSPLYTNSLTLEGNQTLRVIAMKPGWTSGVTNIFFGRLVPEWVTIQTIAGTGEEGTKDGPARLATFRRPYAIGIAPDGTIYIGESAGGILGEQQSVRKIETNGIVSTPWTGFGNPVGVAVDEAGRVLIGDSIYMYRSNSDGVLEVLFTFTDVRDPIGLSLGSNGEVFFAKDKAVLGFTSAGRFLYHRLDYPVFGLARSREGALFAGSPGGIISLDPTGKVEVYAGAESAHADGPREEARFNAPASIYVNFQTRALTFDSNGDLIVADGQFLRKVRTNSVSTLLDRRPGTPGSKLGVIGGIAAHPNGDIYVVADNSVKRVSLDLDQDQIADLDEAFPYSVAQDDRLFDADSDGASNTLEYLAGTDPADATSVPKLIATNAETGIQLSWSGNFPRGDLRLERSTNLPSWAPLPIPISSEGTVVLPTADAAFYRVRIE